MKPETRTCQNCHTDFTIESDDFSFYEKMGVPAPTFCPDCRFQRRLASRNERLLYRSECKLCHKTTLSIYSPESPIQIVYCPACWWSDGWDPFEYAREYDFSRTFFKQYFEFKKSVPHEALYQANFVNSDYANFGFNYKDCYLVSGGWDNERLSYANQVNNISDSFDILSSNHLEFCYETIQSFRSSQLRYCFSCEDSSDLFMCTDCRGCVSCFGCIGLHNKQYHIFNQQYSKTEYEKFIREFSIDRWSSLEALKKQFSEFALTIPYRFSRFRNAVDCTGDNIANSKNARDSFLVTDTENIRYALFLTQIKETYDCSYIGKGGENLYEVISSFGGSGQIGGVRSLFDRNSFYCEDCHNCNDIFGCIGLQKKSYCIFNKQYSKEEYENLLPQIISQAKSMPYTDTKGRTYSFGDFWPIELSPFAYNETKAWEHFPLTKDEILEHGYRWKEKVITEYSVAYQASELPDSIEEAPDSIAESIIGCLHNGECQHMCTRAFKILKSEFDFYKRMNLPLPRLCPSCRHMERIQKQNPFKLWRRKCMCEKKDHVHGDDECSVEFQTPYSSERPEIVFCEKCYQQEVV